MTELTVEGKLYRVSPGGLVWSGYMHPGTTSVVWKRMARGSIRSNRVLVAAGVMAPPVRPEPRPRDRHYARHHI